MLDRLIHAAVLLTATIDPVGTLALFAGLTSQLGAKDRRRTAVRATVYATIVLVGSIFLGQVLLDWMEVQLRSLQVAGGVILFLFGLQMIFGAPGGPSSSAQPESGHDLAVFPLAVPSIAGPGAIAAAIVLADNTVCTLPEQIGVALVLIGVLAVTGAMMLLSTPILRLIGQNGAAILVRVMGMLVSALSVEMVLNGLAIPGWADATG